MMFFEEDDIKTLTQEVSIRDALADVGIKTYRKGSLDAICCLKHNDSKPTNCFIYDDTNVCYCYACGQATNNIEVYTANGYSFYEALCRLAELSGNPEQFEKEKKKKRRELPALSREEKILLGFNPKRPVIKQYVNTTTIPPKDRNYTARLVDAEDGSGEAEWIYDVYTEAPENPWTSLKRDNPVAYLEMILGKILETQNKIKVERAQSLKNGIRDLSCYDQQWKMTVDLARRFKKAYRFYKRKRRAS